ncbi:MAG: hypothetical protein WA902_05825 [Thermosynechococcaceae cyanobacterium]
MKKSLLTIAVATATVFLPISQAVADTVIIPGSAVILQQNAPIPPLVMKDTYYESKMTGSVDALIGLSNTQKLFVYFRLSSIGTAKRIFSVKLIDSAGNTFGYLEPEIKKTELLGRYGEKYTLALDPKIIQRLARVELIVQKGNEQKADELKQTLRKEIRSVYANGSALISGPFEYVLSPIPKPGSGTGAKTGNSW